MYYSLDIETLEQPLTDTELAELESSIRLEMEGKYKKEETIFAHTQEELQKRLEKRKFTRQGARILSVGMAAL